MLLHQILLLLHLAGVIVWVGGMVFAYFCLRPAAAQLLAPPQRLPLFAAALGRFFRLVGLAVGLIVASGLLMFAQRGAAQAPLGWWLMLGLGLAMSAVFAAVVLRWHPRLQRGCAVAAWPEAAAALERIRRAVALNLLLGAATVAAAVLAR